MLLILVSLFSLSSHLFSMEFSFFFSQFWAFFLSPVSNQKDLSRHKKYSDASASFKTLPNKKVWSVVHEKNHQQKDKWRCCCWCRCWTLEKEVELRKELEQGRATTTCTITTKNNNHFSFRVIQKKEITLLPVFHSLLQNSFSGDLPSPRRAF